MNEIIIIIIIIIIVIITCFTVFNSVRVGQNWQNAVPVERSILSEFAA